MVFVHSRQFKPIRGYLITKMGKNKMLKISETIDYTACAKNGAMMFFCVCSAVDILANTKCYCVPLLICVR